MDGFARQLFEFGVQTARSMYQPQPRKAGLPSLSFVAHGIDVDDTPVGAVTYHPDRQVYEFVDGSTARIVETVDADGEVVARRWQFVGV